uniref:Serine-rich protein-like protein n=1 Tax=Kalanchoe fedtschenkoi TaxID=63787 RepID=A0A7N0RHU0_KALFE
MSTASNRRSSGPVIRSLSPSGRFCNSSVASANRYSTSSGFASSTSSFSGSSTFFHRSASPTRVNLYSAGASQSSSSVRFSIDRPISPSRSISAVQRNQVVRKHNSHGHSHGHGHSHLPSSAVGSGPKRTCMCSPTTHPGSFRCSLHKNFNSNHAPYSSNRLNARRSAMTNSLVRIGTVEGDLVKRALAALIRPSSHQQRRRSAFQPRPSRLSVMSKASDEDSQ